MAKDVITRFKLETTQFDSKIKDAAKGLSEYTKVATNAGKDFQKFTKDNTEAAQSLGKIATSSQDLKGKLKELVGAYNEVAKAYETLTDEQKKSDFAKAMSESLVQLQQRIKETKTELYGLGDATKGGGLFGGGKLDGMLQVFGGNIMTKGFEMTVGAVTSMSNEIGECIRQGIQLAKEGEGIRIAFERLGRGDILDGLRQATHNTVTDIELMKAAVKFSDFKLPVEELGTMLAFAQQKAKDTGQSIDYMVDSIVTGLGRKSLMILDNLGLSAAEIKERMKETGDMTKAVGSIIRDQMKSAGDYVETAADRAAQANVSLQNKMEELGRKYAPLQEASNTFWTSVKISILDIVGGPLADFLEGLTEAGRKMNMLRNMKGGDNGNPSKVDRQLSELRGSNYKEQKYNSQLQKYDHEIKVAEFLKKKYQDAGWAGGAVLGEVSRRFNVKVFSEEDIDNIIDSLRNMRSEYEKGAKEIMKPVETNIKTDKSEQNVKTLTAQLKELEKQRKEAVKKGDQELVETITKQISQTKTNLGYLDPNTVKSTSGKSKQQQAEDKVAAALQDYHQTIEKASLELKSGVATEADVKKKQLSAQERLYDAYGDAYALYKDPKYKDAQDKAAEEIVKLGGEVKATTDAQEAAREAARELERSQKKLAEATAKAAEAVTGNDLKTFYQANKNIVANGGQAMQVPIDITYTDSNLQAFIGNIKERLAQSDVGSDLYNSLTKQLADANMLGSFISLAVKNGIDVADIDPQTLWSKIFGDGTTAGDYIPDGFWEGLGEQYEKVIGKGLDVNTNTGEVKEVKQEDYIAKFVDTAGKLTSGLSQMTSGLRSLGFIVPKEVDQIIGVINGVSQVISGVSTIISVFSTTAETANTTALGLNTAAIGSLILALNTNSFTRLMPFMANGGIIPHAANGYYVPGNSYSGDNTMIMANAGELVLSKSQQGNLAAQLDGNTGGSVDLQPYVTGEMVFLGANNHTQRSGQGEIVTTGMLKRMGII